MDFETAYNRVFAGRTADTRLMADCEEIWLAAVAAERERCANACREWQAGRLSHGIGTHDLLRAIEAPNTEVQRRP